MTKRTRVYSISITLLAQFLFFGDGLSAQSDLDRHLDSRPYTGPQDTPSEILIRGATVWTMESAGIQQNTDVLIRDGRISSVGTDLTAADGALVIDATGKHLTPGLIDCHSHSAVENFGVNEGGSSVTSEVQIKHVLDPTDRYLYLQLAGGLTVANVLHGSANVIGGQNAVIKLRWGAEDPAELLLRDAPAGIKFALGENPKRSNIPSLPGLPRRYPQSRMGVSATIRNHFREASEYKLEWERYEALSDAEQGRTAPPRRNLRLEALVEILEGERLVHSHSYRADEILMLIRLAEEFNFKIRTFQHVLEGYRVADEIAAHGAGGSTFSDWWSYKQEAAEGIPFNAALMHDRGVLTSLNSDSGNLARRMNLEAAKTVRYGGLSPVDALATVTINPARQLRIEDRVGSIKAGKDGDVVIWNGDPLSVYSSVDQTFVDGRLMFSRERDQANRAEIEEARAALAESIRNEGKKQQEDATEATGEESDSEAAEEEESTQPEEGTGKDEEHATNPAPPELDFRYPADFPARPTAIVGATVHTLEGEAITSGVVVFEDGKITEVGDRRTRIPRGAERIDARGKHLWPGIIHMQTVLGLTEIDSIPGTVDVGEMGDWNADIDAYLAVHPASAHIPVSRSGGVTHAVVAPQGGNVSGTAALIRTDGWTWEEMAAVSRVSMVISWPGTNLSPFAFLFGGNQSYEDRKKDAREKQKKIEDFFKDAEAYLRKVEATGDDGESDPKLKAMIPVLKGELPLYVTVNDKFAIEDAVNWALDRGLRLIIVGGRDAHLSADFLAERKVPVVLTNVLADPTRGDEPYDVAYSSAAKLHEAGVLVAIAGSGTPGGSSNARSVTLFAGVAAGFGLDREEAFRAITLNPARMLGLDHILGSIAVGKSASLVLTDGDLLEQVTTIEKVWIDGTAPSMQDKQKDLYQKYRNRPMRSPATN